MTSSVYLTKIVFYYKNFDIFFRKTEKMPKMADFVTFGPTYLGPQIFRRHAFVAAGTEYCLLSHIIRVGDANKHQQKVY